MAKRVSTYFQNRYSKPPVSQTWFSFQSNPSTNNYNFQYQTKHSLSTVSSQLSSLSSHKPTTTETNYSLSLHHSITTSSIINNNTNCNTNHVHTQPNLSQISKRKVRFIVPKEFDIRGKPDLYGPRFYKQEVLNTEPLSDLIYHKVPNNYQLVRTTPSNPRQMWQVNAWTPVEGLKKSRGHTGGSKNAILPDRTCLWSYGPSKALIATIPSAGGRYYTGQITCRHRGFGRNKKTKRYYRVIDFKRSILDEEGIVERIEFDPNRSSYIALIRYLDTNRLQYMIAVDGLKPGDTIKATRDIPPKYFRPGYSMPLKYVPDKASICCIECAPGNGAQLIRSAGTFAKLLNKNGTRKGYGLIELQSKELKLFDINCMVTLGRISNIYHNKINWGKAGKRRRLGWRPATRGVAMNPCDHPHGGGTKHKKTRPFHGGGFRTFTGKHMLGFKTRKKKKLRVPIEMQMILKRRPRHFKPGQLF